MLAALLLAAPSTAAAQNDVFLGGFPSSGIKVPRAVMLHPRGLVVAGPGQPQTLGIWDGSEWNFEGGALAQQPGDIIYDIERYGDHICIGGWFVGSLGSQSLACWDGDAWYEPGGDGNGPESTVRALAYEAGVLYVGGEFLTVTQQSRAILEANHLATWDGDWGGVGSGTNGTVVDLEVVNGAVSLVGSFDVVGKVGAFPGVEVNGVAMWKDDQWDALEQGPDNAVMFSQLSAFPNSADAIYTVVFLDAGGPVLPAIGHWNGVSRQWQILHTGEQGDDLFDVYAAPSGEVYAHGDFDDYGSGYEGLARLSGSTWLPLSNLDEVASFSGFTVLDWVGDSEDLYLAHQAGYTDQPVYAPGLVRYDGSHWHGLGSGVGLYDPIPALQESVDALEIYQGDLHAGGLFSVAGDRAIGTVARWDGERWHALGQGIEFSSSTPQFVKALEAHGGELFVGGRFAEAGGQAVTGLASWNGTGWSQVGDGLGGGLVNDLLSVNGHLYVAAGGAIGHGSPDFNLSVWNGGDFAAVGGDLLGNVDALVMHQGKLCAGGTFDLTGGFVSLGRVGCWNGASWQTLGGGVSGGAGITRVSALASQGGNLYAAGNFSMAGGVAASNVARWDGSQWHAMAEGFDQPAVALAALEGRLFAGGDFALAGGAPAQGVAVWDGLDWHSIGDGVASGRSFWRAAGSPCLFVGGTFSMAGDRFSNNLAVVELQSSARAPLPLDDCLGRTILRDDFESGDTLAWSSQVGGT